MNTGILAAIGAYASWGLLPVYWKLLAHVPTLQLLGHRIVWSFVVLALFLAVKKRLRALRHSLSPAVWRIYIAASLLIGVNWCVYVWSVNAGYIVETSLGYFINPLLSVLLGMVFLRERLRRLQWIPLMLAASGVLYLTWSHGKPPWIALCLAVTFSLYGLVKKKAPLGAFEGLTLETGLLLPPALTWLGLCAARGTGSFTQAGLESDLLLVGAGLVTTGPLVLFASAAQRIPLNMIGILQYIAPSIQFLIGVLVYGEAFTHTQMIGFGAVWTAIVLFLLERWWAGRNSRLVV
ncbi:MAG: EamA family transporter RarD [Deltaproteobacteria bacterium]|nr:EamA family transporter RarD [Deltaproteobacteria bacterium]